MSSNFQNVKHVITTYKNSLLVLYGTDTEENDLVIGITEHMISTLDGLGGYFSSLNSVRAATRPYDYDGINDLLRFLMISKLFIESALESHGHLSEYQYAELDRGFSVLVAGVNRLKELEQTITEKAEAKEAEEAEAKEAEAKEAEAKEEIETIDKIMINIGGTSFEVWEHILIRSEYFRILFSGQFSATYYPDGDNVMFIDRDPVCFKMVYKYLEQMKPGVEVFHVARTLSTFLPDDMLQKLQRDFDFFLIDGKPLEQVLCERMVHKWRELFEHNDIYYVSPIIWLHLGLDGPTIKMMSTPGHDFADDRSLIDSLADELNLAHIHHSGGRTLYIPYQTARDIYRHLKE
jgi:hypothetical protein